MAICSSRAAMLGITSYNHFDIYTASAFIQGLCKDATGWTFAQTYCAVLPPCEAPQVRDASGNCSIPPKDCTGQAGKFASDTFKDSGTTKVGDFVMIDGCRAKITFRDSYTNCSFGSTGLGTCSKNVDIEYQFDGTNTPGGATPEKTTKPSEADRCRAGGQNVAVSSTGAVTCTAPSPENPTTTEGTKKKETVNPDGSKTTENKTVVESCTGAGSCVTTVTTVTGGTNPDGSQKTPQTTTTTTTTGTGGKADGKDAGGFCSENPDNVLCKTSPGKEKGKFKGREEEISQAKNDLITEFNNIKAGLSSKFSNLSSGGGNLPCPAPVNVLGGSVSFGCVSGYEGVLAQIGAAVMLMAAFASAFIVLKR